MKKINISEFFKAMSDENRIKILKMLSQKEMNAGELLSELNVTQPTLSHHMKALCECELLNARKQGKWTYYSISTDTASYIIKALEEVFINKADSSIGQTAIKLEEQKSSLPSHLL